MTNTDTADADATALQVAALAHAGSRARARHRQQRRRRRRRARDPAQARRPGHRRAAHRRLPLQRPPAAGRVPGHGARRSPSTASTPATSAPSATTSTSQTIVRVAIEHGKPVRIGVNWGSLDQALLTELMDANARAAEPARCPRRDDRGDAPVGAALGGAGRGDRAGPRPDHPQRQGQRRPGPGRRLPPARRAAATTRCTSA